MRFLLRQIRLNSVPMVIATWILCIDSSAYSQNDAVLTDKQFNQWVFGSTGKTNEETEVSLTVKAVDNACHLSESQKKELRIAGHQDYLQFNREVDELRTQYIGKSYAANNFGKLSDIIEPLAVRYEAGLLCESSQFVHALRRTLSCNQLVKYDANQAEWHHAANVRTLVAILEANSELKSAQRNALVDLLSKQTRPAKADRELDWSSMLVQIDNIPIEKLAGILNASQIQAFKRATQQARNREMDFNKRTNLDDQ